MRRIVLFGLISALGACGDDAAGPDASTAADSGPFDGGESDGAAQSDAPISDDAANDAGAADSGGAGDDAGDAGPPPGAGALAFYDRPGNDDYGQLLDLPPEFGEGEFTFEMWIRPTGEGNYFGGDPDESDGDRWWANGNWFLDGHNNARVPEAMRLGTFDLLFYGTGRVRWLLHDGNALYGVQARPATSAPAIHDGAWHHIAAVRRFEGDGSALELWVDGTRVGMASSPAQNDLREYWREWPGPEDQRGWFFGGEKRSAVGSGGYQYDYDGLIGDVRFWNIARAPNVLRSEFRRAVANDEEGLVGRFLFNEGMGEEACDALGSTRCIALVRRDYETWSMETPPAD